ncbi:hypothetical protein CRM22_008190 [Opisthorchis felineus]|uniref:Uncharacterized protein n=1 Tax=Opisthorchis felineus TaxID=147828 RepID=A0A4S2LCR3_OPIFE|nr:hypothetical protein CRM22_008190 [Opisthorchis felineus]
MCRREKGTLRLIDPLGCQFLRVGRLAKAWWRCKKGGGPDICNIIMRPETHTIEWALVKDAHQGKTDTNGESYIKRNYTYITPRNSENGNLQGYCTRKEKSSPPLGNGHNTSFKYIPRAPTQREFYGPVIDTQEKCLHEIMCSPTELERLVRTFDSTEAPRSDAVLPIMLNKLSLFTAVPLAHTYNLPL